ncbi:MAG: XRE family transcriptional regulator [Clostridia bacterium]|nr:XRE family transcriptional regulator [Clostridia bacterium]
MTFWDRLMDLLRIHKMSQADLSKRLDLSPSFISISMGRKTVPRADFLMQVADYFKVSPRWLMTGEDEEAVDAKYSVVINDKRLMEIGYLLTKCDTDFVELIGELVEHEISHQKTIW